MSRRPVRGSDAEARPASGVRTRGTPDPHLSIILPIFEEEAEIGGLISGIVDTLDSEGASFEVIAVDDGSQDETAAVLRSLQERYPDRLRVARHLQNKGNGAALRTGIRLAHGEIVVTMDADGQHSPDDISKLSSLIPPYDLAIGARTLFYTGSWYRGAANRFYNRFASWLSKTNVEDLTSGFRAMRRSVVLHFLPLFPSGFSAPTTVTLAFLKAGYNVAFLPIRVGQRASGRSKIKLWSDGTRFVTIILRMIMLYDPLRIFLPTGAVLAFTGVLAWVAGVLNAGRLLLPNSAILLLAGAIMTWLLGLIADQISGGRIQYHGDEYVMLLEDGLEEAKAEHELPSA
ncbi:MAG TPA: glycosyltransferase family 2 protein [Anaerolineales bacterium]|nr:glycosyltransferase family 2 protein [Anaerolineales bacterium]